MKQTDNGGAGIRNYALDALKAISIILVLFWHLEPIDVSLPKITQYGLNLLFKEALKAFYFQVTLVAVPVFFIVSLYLYIGKFRGNNRRYFRDRIVRLFSIYLFWLCCQILIYYFTGSFSISSVGFWKSLDIPWYHLLEIGGPALPIVGDSVFYFLYVLIILTAFSTLFMIGEQINYFNEILGGVIILFFFALFEYAAFQGKVFSFLGVTTDFVIYVPIAYFAEKYKNRLSLALAFALFAVYLLFSAQDYFLRQQGFAFGAYNRISIVFGASALFCFVFARKKMRQFTAIRFLSAYSLGIFALHKYFQYAATILLNPVYVEYGVRRKIPVWELMVNFRLLGIALLACLLTVLCVIFLSKTPLKRFVQ